MDWFLYGNGLRHERVKSTFPKHLRWLPLKDSQRENAPSYKTQVLTKRMNFVSMVDIWVAATFNSLTTNVCLV